MGGSAPRTCNTQGKELNVQRKTLLTMLRVCGPRTIDGLRMMTKISGCSAMNCLHHAVDFSFVLRIEISWCAGHRGFLAEKRGILWIAGIDIGGGAAGVDDPLQASCCRRPQQIPRAFNVNLAVPSVIVDRVELPGQVHRGVNGMGLEQVS